MTSRCLHLNLMASQKSKTLALEERELFCLCTSLWGFGGLLLLSLLTSNFQLQLEYLANVSVNLNVA
jgi:hypothetical protein